MKLELWLKKKDNGKSDCFDLTIGQEKILDGSVKNLHVIGTCGECYFWNENPEDISLKGNTMGKCMRTDRWEEKIYGCIHFEQKGGS